MKLLLGLVLQYAAIVGLAAFTLSLLTAPLLASAGRALPSRPARRADLLFVISALPFIGAFAALAATVAPSLLAVFGYAADHCLSHGHHLHLCLLHPSLPSPALAATGAASLAVFLFRFATWLSWQLETRRHLRALENLGVARGAEFAVVKVPGAVPLCHAAGELRRRVFISESLVARLSPEELRCALAHEFAHLERHDPLARFAFTVFALFTAPLVGALGSKLYLQAAEEACDAEAARRMGDGALVASALLKVATLQRDSAAILRAAAFGELSIERRVRLLLETDGVARVRSTALFVAPALAILIAVVALSHAAWIHHAVETALHILY